MTNVIPLFPQRELPRNAARTHFLLETGEWGDSYDNLPDEDDEDDSLPLPTLTTLCGREGTDVVRGGTHEPECEACIEAWARMTGWELPLPTVVRTG